MKPLTKFLVYGGVATAVLGPALVIGVGVSVAAGMGTFAAGGFQDMLPALVESFQGYEPGQDGVFGESRPDAPPLGVAPGGPLNP